MTFPDGIPSTLIRYRITSPAGGGPGTGTLQLMPTVPAIRVPGMEGVFTGGGTYSFVDGVLVDGDGEPPRLLPNNIPGGNPTSWQWLAIQAVNGTQPRAFYFTLDAAQDEIDLGAIQQMDPEAAEYIAVPGQSAYEAWLGAGNDGTEQEFLASLIGPPGDIEAAKAYTDTAITEAVSAEAARSDTAYDPSGTAAAAQNAAVVAAAADASTKADAARTAAESTAAADATNKADAARTSATSTAASDATAKATAAQTAATAAAASDATTKANNAVSVAAADAAEKYEPNATITITNLLSTTPAHFGHRGEGMDSPEHTLAGYRAAVAAGAKAIEVSVNVTADGTLICCHDTTLDRTTYSTGAVNSWTWSELKNRVLTNGRVLHGQGWTDQPIPTLREVLDEFLGRVVIFLEAKGNDSVAPLQTMLTTFYPTANKSVIWKAHIGTLSLPWAKGAGFKTWVYVDDSTTDATMNTKDSLVDYWGVQTSMADARVTQIVNRGKPTFSWPVYRRSQRDRLAGLGVVGMMTSDIQYVSRATPMRTASRWDNQVKEPGGVPTLDYDATYALKFDDSPNAGWVYINAAGQSYGLGTYCPIAPGAGGYRISFDMRFEGIPALTTEHAGIYFGKASDDAYRFGTANATGGYHMVMRANGQMQLNRHTAGVTTGTALGTPQNTTAVVADNPMSFQLDVTPTTIELRRTDSTGWTTGPIADTTYRGLYFGLSNGGITNLATKPHWRSLAITQL